MAQFEKLTAPSQGTPIRFENGQPVVADNPIIPFIPVSYTHLRAHET